MRRFSRLLGTACSQWFGRRAEVLPRPPGVVLLLRQIGHGSLDGRSNDVAKFPVQVGSQHQTPDLLWDCGPDQLVVWELERSQPGGSRAPARCSRKVLQCPTDSRAKNPQVLYHGRILAVVEPSAETQSLGARQPPVKNIPSKAAVYMRGVFIIWGVGGL